jgi:branched-chain amino acid transport system ATP-binding protein
VNSQPEPLHIDELVVARGGLPVLRGISITVAPGAVTTLLGPNGAGKSTLVLTVAGVLAASAGEITLDGVDLLGARPEAIRAHGIAVVPEGRRILRSLSVRDNLRAATTRLPRARANDAIEVALGYFPELRKRLNAPGGSLSGGEQQMVALAQALVTSPRFILIDELSLGLAPVVVRRLIPIVEKLAADGVGVVLIEQFATIALELASYAYLLEGGHIHFAGSADELREHPELLHSAYLSHDRDAANMPCAKVP